EGADVIGIDLCAQIDSVDYPMATEADLAETAALVEAQGRRMVAVQADVRDPAALAAAVERGLAEFGRIDIVRGNAGIASHANGTVGIPEQTWQDMLDVNLTGLWHTVQACVPSMIAAGGGGSLVLTSSAVGLMPVRNIGHYVTAKHGVVGLMRAL